MGGLFLPPPLIFAPGVFAPTCTVVIPGGKRGRGAGNFRGAHHHQGHGELLSELAMAKLTRNQKKKNKKPNPTASKTDNKTKSWRKDSERGG